MAQIEPLRLKKLLRDRKVPSIDEGKSWEAILREITRLKVAESQHEEAVVLYLYQLETVGEKIWRNQTPSAQWDFKKFIRFHEIYDPKRYEDCKVALNATPPTVLNRIGLSAAVVLTKNLNQKLYSDGFKAVVSYLDEKGQNEKGQTTHPLDRVVLRITRDVEAASPLKLRLVRQVRVHSRVPKSRLDKAQERILELEAKVKALEGERTVLKAKISELEAGSKPRHKRVRAAA